MGVETMEKLLELPFGMTNTVTGAPRRDGPYDAVLSVRLNAMNDKLKMILSMAAFGTIAVFVRNIPLSSAEIALFRALIALIFLLGWQAAHRRFLCLRGMGRDLPRLFLSGAAMGFNWIFLFEAYKYTTVSAATLSYYFAPMIVMLASPIMFHERLSARQIFCFMGSTAGLVLVINTGNLPAGSRHLTGVIFGLIAAVLYASVMLMNKKIERASGIDRTLLQFAAAVLVLLPYVLLTGGIDLSDMNAPGWIHLLAVGIVHSGIAYCLYFSALKALKGQETALLSYIDPLVAIMLSFTLLREPVTPVQLLGGALILIFTLLNELWPLRQTP